MPVADAVAQREASLAIANRRRLAQSHLRCEIRALTYPQGAALAADVLTTSDEDLRSMPVLSLLMSVRRVGTHKAIELLGEIGVVRTAATARLRDLTDRQRQVLSRVLLERAGLNDEEAA